MYAELIRNQDEYIRSMACVNAWEEDLGELGEQEWAEAIAAIEKVSQFS